ncbi:MAG: hypothetical protein NTAFB01_19710 [Nitrospira sp.]
MQDPHAGGIGFDVRGVAVDTGNYILIDSYYPSRLPGAQPNQIKLTSDRLIPENLSLTDIDPFPDQAVRATNQDARNEFIVFELPQAGGGYQTIPYQESQRVNHRSFIHFHFYRLDICSQAPGHRTDSTVNGQGEAQPCADQSSSRETEVLTE